MPKDNRPIDQVYKEDKWEEIPKWNGDTLSFLSTAKITGERIPALRIESWRDFPQLLEDDFFKDPEVDYIFRGHRRFDWKIAPTLGRFTTNNIIPSALAEEQLQLFRKAIRGRINDNSLLEPGSEEQDDELWAIGQHYGLKTPLLDWSFSPYVALFFAFFEEDVKSENLNPYRSVYVLNKTFINKFQHREDTVRTVEPCKDDHGRLVNQAGLFTISSSDAVLEDEISSLLAKNGILALSEETAEDNILAKYICKIYIKNEDRIDCMKHLRRMNVHSASLFPDLIGASEYCNSLIQESKIVNDLKATSKEAETKEESEDLEWSKTELEFLSITERLAENAAKMYKPADDNQQMFETLVDDIISFIPEEYQNKDRLHAKVFIIIRRKLRMQRISKEEIENIINLYKEKMKPEFSIDQEVTAFGHNAVYYYGGIVPEDIYVESDNGPVLFASAGEVMLKKEPTSDSSYTYAQLNEVKAK
jgi:hypothetical protein